VRPSTNQTRFTVNGVVIGWATCFLASNLFALAIIAAAGYSDDPMETWPIWVTLASLVGLWGPFLVLLWWSSARSGTGRFREDYRLSFRAVDLVGIPIGVLSQLVLVPLVYWPLETAFPDTFNNDRIEQRARELWDRAEGGWLVALVVAVVIVAPLIEELVYRGLIQQTLQARLDDAVAIVLSAAFFAAIHFAPIEFAGLFAFGLVLAVGFHRTGRLGLPILAHLSFNAVGLAIASGA
jgi:membrane protease YdiL (CAAX protease family)